MEPSRRGQQRPSVEDRAMPQGPPAHGRTQQPRYLEQIVGSRSTRLRAGTPPPSCRGGGTPPVSRGPRRPPPLPLPPPRRPRPPGVIDPAQDLGEQRPRHRHLGELEDHVAPVPHDPGADLDQLLAQGRQRPLLNLLRQGQRAQESVEGGGGGRTALWGEEGRQPRPAQRLLALLIHCSAVPRPL